MANMRFIVACILSSAIMFGASYLWHGVLLNDLSKLQYSLNIFFIFAPIAYIIISIVVASVNGMELMNYISNNVLVQGLLSGAICGLFIYIVSVVVGISFTKSITLKNIALDLPWQMIEQALGGVVVSLVYVFIPDDSYHE